MLSFSKGVSSVLSVHPSMMISTPPTDPKAQREREREREREESVCEREGNRL